MGIYILFYIMIMVFGVLTSYTKRTDSKFFEFCLLAIFVGFAAIRGDVGTDTLAYEAIFKDVRQYGETEMHIESGFYYLNYIVAWMQGGFNLLLFACAGISSWLLFRAIDFQLEENKNRWLAYIVFISTGVYFVYYFSGIRQGISISIFLYAIRFIIQRKFLYYALCIGIGMLFHTSLILMALVYFIPSKAINRYLVLAMVIVALICANIGITNQLFQLVIGGLTGHYGGYAELFSNLANTKSGIGVIIRILLGLTVIFLSPHWVTDRKTSIIYNIFSLGLILYSFFLGVDILVRVSEYMVDTLIFAVPYAVTAFDRKTKPVYIVFVLLILAALYYSNLNFDGMKLVPFKTLI